MCLSTFASTPYCPANLSINEFISAEEYLGIETGTEAVGVGVKVVIIVGDVVGVFDGEGVGLTDILTVGVGVFDTAAKTFGVGDFLDNSFTGVAVDVAINSSGIGVISTFSAFFTRAK